VALLLLLDTRVEAVWGFRKRFYQTLVKCVIVVGDDGISCQGFAKPKGGQGRAGFSQDACTHTLSYKWQRKFSSGSSSKQ
jgi:hypothetical protein